MTMQQHNLDDYARIEREKALRVREAMLAWLRAFEDMHDLPRSLPTLRERGRKDGMVLVKRDADDD